MQILGLIIIRVFAELFARLFTLEVVNEARLFDPTATAKALSALAAILILGIGAVLIIAMSGRWFRRWIFPKQTVTVRASPFAQMGQLDWAKADQSDALGDRFHESDSTQGNTKGSDR